MADHRITVAFQKLGIRLSSTLDVFDLIATAFETLLSLGGVTSAAFTPISAGLVAVGAEAHTGFWFRIGRLVFFTMNITGATSTASTADATTFTGAGLPVIDPAGAPTGFSTCHAVSHNNTTSFGVGQIVKSGASTTIFTPTWAATQSVIVTGMYLTA